MRTKIEHKKFLMDMIKAQLTFIWFKRLREEILDMESLLSKYCMVFNFTDLNLNNILDTVKIEDHKMYNFIIKEVEDNYCMAHSLHDFLAMNYALFEDITESRLDKDVDQFNWLYNNEENKAKGSLWYSAAPEMYFHISNEHYPNSFLDKDNHFENDIKKMAEYAKANNVEEIVCSSWLNQFPKFLSYFPESWAASATTCEDVINGEL